MVRTVVMGAVVLGVLGCKSEPGATSAQLAPLAASTASAATSNGEFRYTQVDGVPMVGWYAPDGKQVILLRVDSRWTCDLSSGQLHCPPRQAASAACTNCQLGACPCADARCLPLCVANASVIPGLHDPAAAAP